MGESSIERVAVIGAGLMGHGIALEYALAGYEVSLHDREDALLVRGRENMRASAQRMASCGLLDPLRIDRVVASVAASTDLPEVVRGADLIVEAISEDLGAKHELYSSLSVLCGPEILFASNTSSFLPSLLARAVSHPERLVVAHYFNPPYLLPLVEIVPGPETSPATVSTLVHLLKEMGKTPVVLEKEATGFVGNRLQFALFREALALVEQGIASPEAVDQVVRFGFGRRLAAAGPFEVFDLAGLDTILSVAEQIFPKLAVTGPGAELVPKLLCRLVEHNQLGVKSGQGFHTWTPERLEELKSRLGRALARSEAAG